MRKPRPTRRATRRARFEVYEPRQMMSAQPLTGLMLDDIIEQTSQPHGTLAEAHLLTGLTQAQAEYGFTGRGQTVAVIDTGIGYDHAALGGGFGASTRVVGGWDFAEQDAIPYDDGPYGSHGTHVAGIIGSSDGVQRGVAPGVDLVALRVFNDAGQSNFAWVEQALQWIHVHRHSFANPITTVNLSIGSAWNSTTVPAWSTLEDDFAQLKADGIFVAVAAGNSFSQYNATGLSYPAASGYVVPVSSVDENGALSSFSQRHGRVIAAPGRSITSAVPDYRGNLNGRADDFVTYSGTSMAAPYVAGASALIREAYTFVGTPSVNQDVIYQLMRNTADTIYDPISAQNYFRLNVDRALDAIMPSDDFGSSAATAHYLGTLGQSRSIAGLIGKLSDQDFFTFTAGQTGTVTLTTGAGSTSPNWVLAAPNGTAAANGQPLSFHVTAGQSYTVSLGSGAGLGRYDLSLTLQASNPIVDWGGVVSQRQTQQRIDAGRNQFALRAARDGILTIEAFFARAAGNVDLKLFNSAGQLVAASYSAHNYERIDVRASAGEQFVLRVGGANQAVDFSLTNLVSETAGKVTAHGTAGADVFQFAAGTTSLVAVNGVHYQFSSTQAKAVHFSGGGGADAAVFVGSDGNDSAVLRPGQVELRAAGSVVTAADVATIVLDGRGGYDSIVLTDSAGNDLFATHPGVARMVGAGFDNSAYGFDETRVYASGGFDIAILRDSAGNDSLTARPESTRLTGSGYDTMVLGFDAVQVQATTGSDQAVFYDSAGDDILLTRPDLTRLTGAGFDVLTYGFDRVQAIASGGLDLALMYDSAGDDLLTARADYARLSGTGFELTASNFEIVRAFAGGGQDQAMLYDSAADDVLVATPQLAHLQGARLDVCAYAFEKVRTYATTGFDRAWLYDSAGNDILVVRPTYSRLTGTAFDQYVQGFDVVHAFGSGGVDQAHLYDSAGDDRFEGQASQAHLRGLAFDSWIYGFDQVWLYSTQGGNDTAETRAIDYLFNRIGNWR